MGLIPGGKVNPSYLVKRHVSYKRVIYVPKKVVGKCKPVPAKLVCNKGLPDFSLYNIPKREK
jgi:hypothetical protein